MRDEKMGGSSFIKQRNAKLLKLKDGEIRDS